MKTNLNRKLILILYLGMILILPFFSIVNFNSNYLINETNKENSLDKDLKTAGYWNLTGFPIFIDDADPNYNWSKTAKNNDWCSGSGTWGDPYIIENVTIDGEMVGSCITIQNSSVYFIIKNCTVTTSGFISFDAGISLDNVNNSLIINNSFSHNYFAGILLRENCVNNTIQDNIWQDDEYYCILLYQNCYNNKILKNKMIESGGYAVYFFENINNNIIANNFMRRIGWYTASGQAVGFGNDCNGNVLTNNIIIDIFDGIYLNQYCDDNIISNNFISNNYESFGIALGWYCNNNTIFNNTISEIGLSSFMDGIGIYMVNDCDNNNISKNTIIENDYYSIYLGAGSGNNTISENICGNDITSNQEIGIYLVNSDDNTITGNVFQNNTWRGLDIDANTDDCLIYRNFFINSGIKHARDLGTNNNWNSSTIGNFWDNYTGVDDDQDGIGDTAHSFGNIIDYLPIWDDDAPNINIKEPSMNQFFGSNTPSFIVEITDVYLERMWYSVKILEFTIEISFTENGTIDKTLWNSLGEGTHTISFHASDDFHHITTKNVTIIKDTINPSINILFPLNGQTYNSTAPIFIVDIADNNLDKMWYTINTDMKKYFFTNNDTIQDWSDIPNGPVVITFFANDSAGNVYSEFAIIIKYMTSPVTTDPTIIIMSVAFSTALAGAGIAVIYLLRTNKSLKRRFES